MKESLRVLQELGKVDLLNEQTLVKIGDKCFDYSGKEINSEFFNKIKSKYAVFSSGEFSMQYSKKEKPLFASTDDAAQMFGYKVKNTNKKPRTNSILSNKGFVCVGKTIQEVVAAAILMEKMCRTETLGPKIGEIKYLPRALCTLEHAVYAWSYSKRGNRHE